MMATIVSLPLTEAQWKEAVETSLRLDFELELAYQEMEKKEEALRQIDTLIVAYHTHPCRSCGGKGKTRPHYSYVDRTQNQPCKECEGSGKERMRSSSIHFD